MIMKRPFSCASAACLTVLGVFLVCAAFAGGTKKVQPAEKNPSGEGMEGADKSRFEAYLKERLSKIQESHKVRMDFFDREKATWDNFWVKIRDDRRKFEIRITRQTLDLFESLASLDSRDRAGTVSNFEKLQGDLIKSFEQQQKQKMQDFFNDHAARWRDFANDQEKERAQFMADAETGWRENKASIKDQDRAPSKSSKKSSKKAAAKPADENDQPDEEEPPPKKKPSKKPSADDSEDHWH